ncbi:hypothetical protein [Clostridium phage Amboise]|nr:hypothetical protein [Clostridium phage Amboise]DAH78987.1 MAG TPA: hypothetical protein [Caudoviricetes sp.]
MNIYSIIIISTLLISIILCRYRLSETTNVVSKARTCLFYYERSE